MRSETTLRKVLLLYLALVLKDLPYDTVSCATCRRSDGSYAAVSLDGLQLGDHVKYKLGFTRRDVKVRPVPRASLVPCLISDEALSKALGRVLSAKRDAKTTASNKAMKTITAIRGHVMAVALLLGNIVIDDEEQSFAGDKPHLDGVGTNRGWDPTVDGGAPPALVAFLRWVFDLRFASRSLSLTIESSPDDLRRRVPAALMQRVHVVAAEIAPPSFVAPPVIDAGDDSAELAARDGDLLSADAGRGRKRARVILPASSSTSSSIEGLSSGTDVMSSEKDNGFYMPRSAKTRKEPVWEREAPLLRCGELLGESALATTGGGHGADRLQNLSPQLLPHIPSTAASALKIMEFVRAIVVDPAVVRSPQGSWEAVEQLLAVLQSEGFSIASLGAVLRSPVVAEQRLLRGAVGCLGPGLEADPGLRHLLSDVLLGLTERVALCNEWVSDGDSASALD